MIRPARPRTRAERLHEYVEQERLVQQLRVSQSSELPFALARLRFLEDELLAIVRRATARPLQS